MPDPMGMPQAMVQGKKDNPHGVQHPARRQPDKSGSAQRRKQRFDRYQHDPAHYRVNHDRQNPRFRTRFDLLRGAWGWTLFGIVWGLALIGILQEIKPRSEARILSIVIYAVMGWIVLVAVKPLLAALGTAGFVWLASGGVLYTVGIIFFALDHRLRHAHGIWHLFVIAGSLLHFVAILFYVL